MHKKIAILAGDGIGPEVMDQTLRVLDIIAKKYAHHFEFVKAYIGGAAYDLYQSHCPQETIHICEKSDAILFGSVGGPVEQQYIEKWKNCETNSILKLRHHFDLNTNIRIISVYPEISDCSPLKERIIAQGVNIVVFRELTGGIYFGDHDRQIKNNVCYARDICEYNETQIRIIARAAFKAAQWRLKRIHSIDKNNVLATSKLWRQVMTEVVKDYPDVELTHMLIDNCAMQMVLNPSQFDVIVTENMFGDILSDLAAALSGSLGMIPSASLNASGFGLFEPSGGSAPDIAGKGIANPIAQILSAAMMLRYSFNMEQEAYGIEQAIKKTISSGVLTADISGKAVSYSTQSFVDKVVFYLEENTPNV